MSATPGILATAYYGDADAEPLLFIRALPAEIDNPRGIDRVAERFIVRGPSRTHRVHAVGRPAFLPLDFDMSEIAAVYGRLIRERFGRPVAVMGLSTGASVALQLAVDQPDLVKTLVIAAGAARLGTRGRILQRRYVSLLAANDRRAYAELASGTLNSRLLDPLVRLFGRIVPQPDDPESLIALVRAEDAYDVLDGLHRVTAPTLILSGGRDVFYPPEVGRETARRLPRATHIVYPGRPHGGVPLHPHFAGDIAGFLRAQTG
ncbi:alpha/beta fold hydrolase [Leifsonia poae]|uniref:alpha/beta fold hydrolase n=1 Tax=Leifsonia poae TaxID=110933 RepID=UPI001CBBDF5F|nr:alpha/beta hydrolase [Leifsonia poae]